MTIDKVEGVQPFERSPALDGYHCVTNSLAKIYHHYGHPLAEDMLFGLGAGMGFIYWAPKGGYPFIGGRANLKGFYKDLGDRTGVRIAEATTASDRKAEAALVEQLRSREPAMLAGDMGLLPWFEMPGDYHFGGHTFVACGYDGSERVLCSDMDQKASGLKKGFYYVATLEQLRRARGSKFKPFPPKNALFGFDFSGYHPPEPDGLRAAIEQAASAMLEPPIKNIGVRGIRHAAREIQAWPDRYDRTGLVMSLFNLYIFVEIGGTGGGCFRYMYARFLREAAKITVNDRYEKAAGLLDRSGRLFTAAALLFRDYEDKSRLQERIGEASRYLANAADLEEEAFRLVVE